MRTLPPPKKIVRTLANELRVELSIISPIHGGCPNWDANDERTQHVRRADPVTPVRGSAIRGQLRFWWRATYGCTTISLKAMKEQEDRLWGNASTPGIVQLRLEGNFQGADLPVFEAKFDSNKEKWKLNACDGMREVAYGAFALQPKGDLSGETPRGVLTRITGQGTLTLSLPPGHNAELAQVKDALIAWLLFGGIGGRTRRGFGAVYGRFESPPERLPTPESFIGRFSAQTTLPMVPSLHQAKVRIRLGGDKGLDALKTALGRLMTFRQGEHFGRNERDPSPGNKKPAGRSRWPEPESIRMLTGKSSTRHRERFVKIDKFPRARFGLPIIFHFQDEKEGEPGDTELRPEGKFTRMASPLIVRPLRQDSSYGALCLVMRVPDADSINLVLKVLKGNHPRSPWNVDATLSAREARNVRPLNGNPDPLDAFLEFFGS